MKHLSLTFCLLILGGLAVPEALAMEASSSLQEQLQDAVMFGDLEEAKEAISLGADVNKLALPNYRELPLVSAVLNNDLPLVKLLLDSRANINASSTGRTALMAASSSGEDSTTVIRLLITWGAEINARDEKGNTALHYVAKNPKNAANGIKAAQELIQKGANINALNQEGRTPLMEAAKSNYKEYMRFLLKNGADPFLKDNDKKTALALVLDVAGGECYFNMLYYDAFIELQKVMLICAVKTNDINDAKEALFKKVSHGIQEDIVNMLDNTGTAALGYAVINRNIPMILLLLAYEADIDIKDSKGNTPLHYAVLNRLPYIIKVLLSLGADPRIQNNQDQSPVDLAVVKGPKDLLPIFLRAAHASYIK